MGSFKKFSKSFLKAGFKGIEIKKVRTTRVKRFNKVQALPMPKKSVYGVSLKKVNLPKYKLQ